MEIERPAALPVESAPPSIHGVLEELLELGNDEDRKKELLLAFGDPPALKPMERAEARHSTTKGSKSLYFLLISENEVACLTTPGAIITNIINSAIFSGEALSKNELKLFVRDDYVGLYDNIMARKSSRCEKERKNFQCLVTGNPGIGKTMFLIYFMMRVMYENRGNPRFRMAIAVAGAARTFSPLFYAFTRKSGWFKISDERFRAFRFQETSDPDCWIFADSIDIMACGTNSLITASPNSEYFKFYAKGQTVTLHMPLWTLNELIFVFRKIIMPAPGDSGASSAVPIAFTSTDPAAGWKKVLKERENCKNPFECVLPALIDKASYELGKEAEAGDLTEDKIILRFFVRGGVPRTVYSFDTLPNMWAFILSSDRLTGQVLEKLYRDANSSAPFSMKQDDAEHRVITYVIVRSDDPLENYEWLKGTMFKAISEYARFLLGEKFKRRSLFDDFLASPMKKVDVQGDSAVLEGLGHKYLAGSGCVLIEENAQLKRTLADRSKSNEELLHASALIEEENARLKRAIADRAGSNEEQLLTSALEEIARLKRAIADKELEFLRLKEAEDVGPDERKKKRRS